MIKIFCHDKLIKKHTQLSEFQSSEYLPGGLLCLTYHVHFMHTINHYWYYHYCTLRAIPLKEHGGGGESPWPLGQGWGFFNPLAKAGIFLTPSDTKQEFFCPRRVIPVFGQGVDKYQFCPGGSWRFSSPLLFFNGIAVRV